jgi:16S rRNA (cytidine1402-2'-O)-methyltransferase
LKNADEIICEDTRRTIILLNHYEIKKPLTSLNDFNEVKVVPEIINKLQSGKIICLVSDAGTPLISDPGYKLVREALAAGLEVDSLPGPSAVTDALTLSSLPPDKFIFLGYPPDKPGHRKDLYQKIKTISETLPITFILFSAPFKLKKTLEEMKENLGDIDLTLAKELTKMHQKVESKKISDWLDEFKTQPKGEYVMLFRV